MFPLKGICNNCNMSYTITINIPLAVDIPTIREAVKAWGIFINHSKEVNTMRTDKEIYGKHCIGRVLRILDNRTIITSATKDNLKVGDSIIVYEVGDEIFNPDGTKLCNYEYCKDSLDVIEVNDLYSVCRKNVITKTRVFDISPVLTTTTYETLPIDKSSIKAFEVKNNLITLGDPVKLA